MVFESRVVDLLNRVLGDYFENVDTSQLNLGFWGGDVVFHNLVLKNSALDKFGLPFKIVLGRLGTLTMKIPWTNLYTSPVELKLTDLFLLVVPSYAVSSDQVGEQQQEEFAKAKEIERVDEIRRKQQARILDKDAKTQQQTEDNFMEKLMTQVIKNVQLKIETIHLRYEDNVTKPGSPFAFGLTLSCLDVNSTDGNWKLCEPTDTEILTFYKMVKLDSLSVYWNSQAELIQTKGRGDTLEMLKLLLNSVISDDNKNSRVLGPINLTAKLTVTPSPDKGNESFSKPKFLVDVFMEELALSLTNLQFHDMVELAEAIDLTLRAKLYRKYRPKLNLYRGHFREWWKFAYQCIIENEVRRRHRNWTWNYLKGHRDLCKNYANAYYHKLTRAKLHPEVIGCLAHCEKALDVFNLTLIRKLVEMRINREGKLLKDAEALSSQSWFSGWIGGGESNRNNLIEGTHYQPTNNHRLRNQIKKKVEKMLSGEERRKLYTALDYSENAKSIEYPETYEEYCVSFKLAKLNIAIKDIDEELERNLLDLQIDNVQFEVKTRPVKKAVSFVLSVDALTAFGYQPDTDSPAPAIVTSLNAEGGSHLLHIAYQSHPLNSTVDRKLVVRSKPIEIVYDSKTVTKLTSFFKIPKHAELFKFHEALASSAKEWKEKSIANLKHILDTRGEVELDIHLVSPYLIIPQNGVLTDNEPLLITDFGQLSVKSIPREKNWDKQQFNNFKSNDTQKLEIMRKSAYDCFRFELTDFQIILAQPNEDYVAFLTKTRPGPNKTLPKYLVLAKKVVLTLELSMLPEDKELPRVLLHAHFPLLDVNICENRLLALLKLIISFPQPDSERELGTGSKLPVGESTAVAESYSLFRLVYRGDKILNKMENKIVDFIEMLSIFTVQAVKIRLQNDLPLLNFELNQLKVKVQKKSYSWTIDLGLGGFNLCAPGKSEEMPIYLLKTPTVLSSEESDKCFMLLHLFQILPNCPLHLTGTVKQAVKVDLGCLEVNLNQEIILNVMGFVEDLAKFVKDEKRAKRKNSTNEKNIVPIFLRARGLSTVSAADCNEVRILNKENQKKVFILGKVEARRKAIAKKHCKNAKDVLVQILLKMEAVTVQLSSLEKDLMKIDLNLAKFSLVQRKESTALTLELSKLLLRNMEENSLYQNVITVKDERVVYLHLMIFDKIKSEDVDKCDMSVQIVTGSLRMVYLPVFMNQLLNFLANLKIKKEAMHKACTKQVEIAKRNVKDAMLSNSKRILLNVNVNLPVIILPRNESTPHALLADLGRLSIHNQFSLEKVGTGQSDTGIVIEKAGISLQNVKVSRIFWEKIGQNVRSEVLILEPLHGRMGINRNMSADWYHALPGFAIKGNAAGATVRLSKEDYEFVLSCICENILPSPKPEVSSSKVKANSRKLVKVNNEQNEAVVNLELFLEMPQLKLILYEHPHHVFNLAEKVGLAERDASTAFVCLSVQDVSTNCTVFSDQSVTSAFRIGNVSLLDVRSGTRAISNLLQRKFSESTEYYEDGSNESVFKLSYKTWLEEAKTMSEMEIQTTSLTLIFSLDYLLQIGKFFEKSGHVADLVKRKIKQNRLNPISEEEKATEESENSKSSVFNAIYNFSVTEILLVETLDTLDTKCLLLNCQVAAKQDDTEGNRKCTGTLQNLKLISCVYNPTLRESSQTEVISPTEANLEWNSSLETGSLIDVSIGNIFVRFTAETVELLSKIFGLIKSKKKLNEKETKSSENFKEIWKAKEIAGQNFWFLKPEEKVDQEDATEIVVVTDTSVHLEEKLLLESGSIVFTFETGSGSCTMPLFLIETGIDLQMWDWSSELKISGKMKLEAAYYNAMFGLWEFLVEHVQTVNRNRVAHQPWELSFDFNQRPGAPSTLQFQSNDMLELTVTKTALNTLTIISQEFKSFDDLPRPLVSTAPFTIANQTGMEINLGLMERGKSGLLPLTKLINGNGNGRQYERILLQNASQVDLALVEDTDKRTKPLPVSILRAQETKLERFLALEIPEVGFGTEIPLSRCVKRYYSDAQLICQVGVKDCTKVVTLRGTVEIINQLRISVEVYFLEEEGGIPNLAGIVQPEVPFNLPICATRSETWALRFSPEGYSLTCQCFRWDHKTKGLTAANQKAGQDNFHFRVVSKTESVLAQCSNRKDPGSLCYAIYLKAPVILKNLLPVQLAYYVYPREDHKLIEMERGESCQVTNLIVGKDELIRFYLKIGDYNGQSWKCEVSLSKASPKLTSWIFSGERENAQLTLGILREREDNEEIVIQVYCPFWMVNKTGLNLIYKGGSRKNAGGITGTVSHPSDYGQPVMFSFSGKNFAKKKCSRVKVHDSKGTTEWSERFNLIAGGTKNCVTCRGSLRNWQIGVEVEMSICGLTRYIIFSSRFYLVNGCGFKMGCVEEDGGNEVEVGGGKCKAFWPKSEVRRLRIKVGHFETKGFRYDLVESTMLRLDGELGGIEVDVEVKENRTVIRFGGFKEEKVPVVVVNGWQGMMVEFVQLGESEEKSVLESGYWEYFTWGNPVGSRVLEWGPVGNGKKLGGQTDLRKDRSGSFEMNGKDFYWISFLNGEQRCLLFTEKPEVVRKLEGNGCAEIVDQVPSAEYTVNLHGLGLSLVDNENLKEILYMRIASSEIVWEQRKDGKRRHFKPLPAHASKNVETAYQHYLKQMASSRKSGGGVKSVVKFDSGLEVDFYFMRGRKPHETEIRRNFQIGVWLSLKKLRGNCTEFQAKLNRIQIDNQLPDALNRVVFGPVKPPKTVLRTDAPPKPFVEVNITRNTNPRGNLKQYKYFKVLVQEFFVKADVMFANALVELFQGNVLSVEEWRQKYKMEYDNVGVSLEEFLEKKLGCQAKKHFYDNLYLSPLKIHLSFSMTGSANVSNDVLKLVLASLGVTLTEVHDLVFKLACFEMQHRFLSKEQLKQEVRGHYVSQGLKQFYVLLFGLDVIGNPCGLAVGVAKGLETFFYEPFQGAIQGPREFAEGMVLGVKSLVCSTIRGTAGACSKITGSLGKGVAVLTFDKEFQRRRMESLQNRGDAAEVLARSGIGLVMSFYEGATGLVTKPVEGWKENRTSGVILGACKGTAGLVAKPVSGIVDFASGSFDAVKKVTSALENVRRLRPPRYIPGDNILQPYICHEAEGVHLLSKIAKGKYCGTDDYVAHALINPHGHYVLLMTSRQILYLKYHQLFGTWETKWNHVWEDFAGPPVNVERGLLLQLKEERVIKFVNFVVSRSKQLFVPIYSAEVATWLISKIGEAMRIESGMGWNDGAELEESLNGSTSAEYGEVPVPVRLARLRCDGF